MSVPWSVGLNITAHQLLSLNHALLSGFEPVGALRPSLLANEKSRKPMVCAAAVDHETATTTAKTAIVSAGIGKRLWD